MSVNMSLDGILSYLRRFWSKTRQRLGQYLGILFLYFVFVITPLLMVFMCFI